MREHCRNYSCPARRMSIHCHPETLSGRSGCRLPLFCLIRMTAAHYDPRYKPLFSIDVLSNQLSTQSFHPMLAEYSPQPRSHFLQIMNISGIGIRATTSCVSFAAAMPKEKAAARKVGMKTAGLWPKPWRRMLDTRRSLLFRDECSDM